MVNKMKRFALYSAALLLALASTAARAQTPSTPSGAFNFLGYGATVPGSTPVGIFSVSSQPGFFSGSTATVSISLSIFTSGMFTLDLLPTMNGVAVISGGTVATNVQGCASHIEGYAAVGGSTPVYLINTATKADYNPTSSGYHLTCSLVQSGSSVTLTVNIYDGSNNPVTLSSGTLAVKLHKKTES